MRVLRLEKFDKWNDKLSRRESANRIIKAWSLIEENNIVSGFQKTKQYEEPHQRLEEFMEIEEISYIQIRN